MGITSQMERKNKKLPECLNNPPFRLPKEKTGLHLPCASLSSPPLVSTSCFRRNKRTRGRQQPVPLSALPHCPRESRVSWECFPNCSPQGGSLEAFLWKHSQERGNILYAITASFKAALEAGWEHSGALCLFCRVQCANRRPGALVVRLEQVNLHHRGFYRIYPNCSCHPNFSFTAPSLQWHYKCQLYKVVSTSHQQTWKKIIES